jgi:hypothetical protein
LILCAERHVFLPLRDSHRQAAAPSRPIPTTNLSRLSRTGNLPECEYAPPLSATDRSTQAHPARKPERCGQNRYIGALRPNTRC